MSESSTALRMLVLLWALAWVPGAGAETARVAKVLDGDTVVLEDGRAVRYLGVNAPEFLEPLYRKAKRRNEELVLGKAVRLEYDRVREDRYGRALAWVFVGEDMVNIRLVREGLAHVFIIPPNGSRAHELLLAQGEAQQERLGMWRHSRGPLKVTAVRNAGGDAGDRADGAEYVRIANLSPQAVSLGGYRLSSGSGRSYRFPEATIEPGHTVLVVSGPGQDGRDAYGRLRLHWSAGAPIWGEREDTAYLEDPTGRLVDVFHYKGRRVSRRLPARAGKGD